MRKILLAGLVLAVAGVFGVSGSAYCASVGIPSVSVPRTVVQVVTPEPEVKIVEKEVIVEKIVEKPVDRIVEKIVEKPVDRVVEKIVEKTVYVDKPVKEIVKELAYVNVQDVYFAVDSSTLTPFTRGILDNNAEVFKKYPQLKAVLVGCASPEATSEYNLKLSERRATAVKNYLVNAGVPEETLTIKPIGELEAAKSAWPFARKVHFEVISE